MCTERQYLTGLDCEKKLWLSEHKTEAQLQTIKANDEKPGALTLLLHKEAESAEQQLTALASQYLTEHQSGEHRGGNCLLRVIEQNGEASIIKITSSTAVKPKHIDALAFLRHDLNPLIYGDKPAIKSAKVLHINNQYTRCGALDVDQLFTLADCTAEAAAKEAEVTANITRFNAVLESAEEPAATPCDACRECEYAAYCKPQLSQKAEKNEPPHIDKAAICAFLDTLRYPLYFLDFETWMPVIPEFDNSRPWTQIPFQYSLHIQRSEGAEPEHKEFLAQAGSDPRRALAEKLCEDIPENACTLAWSMSFEKGRIRHLADIYPDLAPYLLNIHDHIIDLATPFKNGAHRTPEMRGSWSIKAVLPALFPDDPRLDYSRLKLVHSGADAMALFPALKHFPPEQQAEYRQAMLDYCRLDTLAMVEILNHLQHLVKEQQ